MKNRSEKFAYANMDAYVVHIYRRDRQHPDQIIGMVETINTNRKEAFKGSIELMSILTRPSEEATVCCERKK